MQTSKFKANLSYSGEFIDLPASGDAKSNTLNIFLHGYAENSQVFHNRIKKNLVIESRSLFLNGCFPIPTIRNNLVLYQYAWYFFDRTKNEYFIDFSTPINYIKNLIEQIDTSEIEEIVIIGYSQGGYLAPFLKKKIKLISKVICINASIREDMLPLEKSDELDFDLIQIQAADDEIIDPILARERFEAIGSRCRSSQFILIKNEKHFLSTNTLKTLDLFL